MSTTRRLLWRWILIAAVFVVGRIVAALVPAEWAFSTAFIAGALAITADDVFDLLRYRP